MVDMALRGVTYHLLHMEVQYIGFTLLSIWLLQRTVQYIGSNVSMVG